MSEVSKQKIKIVLQNILEKYALTGAHPVLGIDFDSDEIALGIKDYEESLVNVRERELDRLLLLLQGLAEKDILESVERKHRIHHSELVMTDTYVIYFPEDFRIKALDYLRELSGNDKQEKTATGLSATFVLYLEKDGSLWHGNKEQYCYPMKATSNRLRIIKYLIGKSGYQPPRDMLPHLETKTTQTLRSEIGKIRKNITKFLDINGDEVIESKGDSGYRINPKYKILLSRD